MQRSRHGRRDGIEVDGNGDEADRAGRSKFHYQSYYQLTFDFGAEGTGIDLRGEMQSHESAERNELDMIIAECSSTLVHTAATCCVR